jgi:DNA-binding transcriptional regulator YiaG
MDSSRVRQIKIDVSKTAALPRPDFVSATLPFLAPCSPRTIGRRSGCSTNSACNASSDIARIRQELNYSQSVFARVLNVSLKTVQAWEQGIRVPSDAALKLLTIAKRHPEVLLEA